ncbi:4-diphosphocytidyl-2C-methyl-D-erythritol kinase [Alkaliphilus metalliredigens QYMF]|uniref:4-diphosphocytidyl-2-C-methyl-D-erythritol kinase n=1 Tax=Alkaliphilus metalliredigens (strain QYMF) TaxID=293826 RepID=ISPE_ALKMQ|nr:4-(cytidine 5'-diphospho)-2-C-methyl-D-erythritol kinase [Alkaliphilus metalliredigens]A6TWV7.1 RecName: Full=4-diphosphocytidyl-2-C-methyl-D-erythritol kinase; Short=CMK; AltName: Full=4-(cytidine-5'-diphospho)-2-C-methyl-D-erythritol kinase [Alkaliphilus metalliredigens QYMF]ABR50675.1 4-diphosphocytidyl-2C-methyl-D-erythritol kinase [Alkaliphilus metalliredigens QYMF]
MKQVQLKSRAKINLSLDVLGRRSDGYHEVEMIMQQIDLYDLITLEERKDSEIRISTQCEFIPTNEDNIAYRAAEIIRENSGINRGVNIYIDKRIPVAAGLAGGSSNAAAVLEGLNHMWRLRLTPKQLMDLGVKLGADVPFCILGGAAIARGIGEILTPIEGLKNVWMVIAKPAISVSTAEVYRQLDLSKLDSRPNTDEVIQAVKEGDLYTLAGKMHNVLESVTQRNHPIIREMKRKMLEYNAIGAMMSGSGPTVFGIYKNYGRAKSAYENLSILYKQTHLVQSYSRRKWDE